MLQKFRFSKMLGFMMYLHLSQFSVGMRSINQLIVQYLRTHMCMCLPYEHIQYIFHSKHLNKYRYVQAFHQTCITDFYIRSTYRNKKQDIPTVRQQYYVLINSRESDIQNRKHNIIIIGILYPDGHVPLVTLDFLS